VWRRAFGTDPNPAALAELTDADIKRLLAVCIAYFECPSLSETHVRLAVSRTPARFYCADFRCSHSIAISTDQWPDHVRLSDLESRFVCKACGKRGADIRHTLRTVPSRTIRGKKTNRADPRTKWNVTNSEKRNFESVPPLNPNNF